MAHTYRMTFAAATLLVLPALVSAQAGTTPPPAAPSMTQSASIDSGMTRAQVVERLGKPAAASTRGPFTYLFYANGAEKEVGTADIVILDNDKVIDAIFRSPARTYSGKSSSPRAIPPEEAQKANPRGTVKAGTGG